MTDVSKDGDFQRSVGTRRHVRPAVCALLHSPNDPAVVNFYGWQNVGADRLDVMYEHAVVPVSRQGGRDIRSKRRR